MSSRLQAARTLLLFGIIALLITPGWGKKLKTSSKPSHPISNYHYDATAQKIILQDGIGEVGTDSVKDFDAAYQKDILDGLNAVPAFKGKLTKVMDATITYNCHGKTFKNRQFWVGLTAAPIETILKDQGWNKIDEKDAKVGDIVVYRYEDPITKMKEITHTGVVAAVADGKVTQVISKWGNLPEFMHAPALVPQGQEWTVRGVKSKLPFYGEYEVRSGGKPLNDPEREDLPETELSPADFPNIDRLGYSTPPVETVSIQAPSTIHVGQLLPVTATVQGAGIGSFYAPVTYSFPGGEDGAGKVEIMPGAQEIAVVYADENGVSSVSIEGERPGTVVYGIGVKELGVVAYGILQVIP